MEDALFVITQLIGDTQYITNSLHPPSGKQKLHYDIPTITTKYIYVCVTGMMLHYLLE